VAADPVSVSPLVKGVRWTTLGVGLLLATFADGAGFRFFGWGCVLVVDALLRTVGSNTRAHRRADGPFGGGPLGTTVDVLVASTVVASTGGWNSPFLFSLLPSVVGAGLARGFDLAGRAALLAVLGVGIPYHLQHGVTVPALLATGQSAVGLVLAATVAGYLRHLFGQAEQRHSVALDRMTQLNEANDLLVSLHRVVQTLPASLDLEHVLRSTLDQLRNLIASDVAVVLIRDDVTGRWTVGASDGATLGHSLAAEQLPAPLRAAAASSVASLVVCLAPGEGLGSSSTSRSGLYAPLRARGALVGLIALEHHEPGFYERRDLRLLDGFTGHAALGIDNAAWFGRLRAMGAEEERIRIARDMHDSVGQSLAYLAFKLDRITNMAEDDRLRAELEVMRGEVRGVLGEVREALCDLRTDVTDKQGLVETLQAFLDRVASRTDLELAFHHEEAGRLPIQQERELWRIAHEAVTNAERHAGARHLHVRWYCDGESAHLTVADDGRGFPARRMDRTDHYGITGMKERASAIGASLNIESEPFVGTLVECRLDPGPARLRSVAGAVGVA
jgi:signal transduction histidine kinase